MKIAGRSTVAALACALLVAGAPAATAAPASTSANEDAKTVTTYASAADYFGCKIYRHVWCHGRP